MGFRNRAGRIQASRRGAALASIKTPVGVLPRPSSFGVAFSLFIASPECLASRRRRIASILAGPRLAYSSRVREKAKVSFRSLVARVGERTHFSFASLLCAVVSPPSETADATESMSPSRGRSVTLNASNTPVEMMPQAIAAKDATKEAKRGAMNRQRSYSRLNRMKITQSDANASSPSIASPSLPPLSSGVMSGHQTELVDMLVLPEHVKGQYWPEFFFALRYIIEPTELLALMLSRISSGSKESDDWSRVLFYWVENHFYYFSASKALMTFLLVDSASALGSKSSQMTELVEGKTKLLISAKSDFGAALDVDLLKAILQSFVDGQIVYDEIEFNQTQGILLLSNSSVLLSSLNVESQEGISSDLFVRNAAQNVLRRLVAANFLRQEEEAFVLSSSSVAVHHTLVVAKRRRENLENLRLLMKNIKEDVGIKALKDERGEEHLGCISGRAMLDAMQNKPQIVPVALCDKNDSNCISEQKALALGKALMENNLIQDNTSGAFNMFSATHLYSLPLRLNLGKSDLENAPEDETEVCVSLERRSSRIYGKKSPVSPVSNSESTISPLLSPVGMTQESVDQLVEVDVSLLAQCFIALDSKLLKCIDLTEFDFTAWKRKDDGRTIRAWIDSFNRTSYLIATEIVTCPWPEERMKLLEKFINVANQMLELRNFQALFAIMGGLGLNSVSRLTDLMEKTIDSRLQITFDNLKTVVSSRNNFKAYRALLVQGKEEGKETIPYIGLLLQDVLSIEEIPKCTRENIINFDRLRKLGQAKNILQRAQRVLREEAEISGEMQTVCNYLNKGLVLDPESLHLISRKIQGRAKSSRKTRK